MQGRPERSRPPLKTVKKDSAKTDKLIYKPLTGKVFYLDIPSNTLSDKIAKDLKELGGVSCETKRGKAHILTSGS